MPISVTCDDCGATYNVPDDKAGQKGKCKCGSTMVVPSAEPAASTVSLAPLDTSSGGASEASSTADAQSVACPHCGMKSRPGAECEWCHEPLGGTQTGPGQAGAAARSSTGRDAATASDGGPPDLVKMIAIAAAVIAVVGFWRCVKPMDADLRAMLPAGAVAVGAAQIQAIKAVTIAGSVGLAVTAYFCWAGHNWARFAMMVFLVLAGGEPLRRCWGQFNAHWDLDEAFQLFVQAAGIVMLNLRPVREYFD